MSLNINQGIIDKAAEFSALSPENQKTLILEILPDFRAQFLRTIIASMPNKQLLKTLESVKEKYLYLFSKPKINIELIFNNLYNLNFLLKELNSKKISIIFADIYSKSTNEFIYSKNFNIDTSVTEGMMDSRDHIISFGDTASILNEGDEYILKVYVQEYQGDGSEVAIQLELDEEGNKIYPDHMKEFEFLIDSTIPEDINLKTVLKSSSKHLNSSTMTYLTFDGDSHNIMVKRNDNIIYEQSVNNGDNIIINHKPVLTTDDTFILYVDDEPEGIDIKDYIYNCPGAYTINPQSVLDYNETKEGEVVTYNCPILPDENFEFDLNLEILNDNFSIERLYIMSLLNPDNYTFNDEEGIFIIDKSMFVETNIRDYDVIFNIQILAKDINESLDLRIPIVISIQEEN